MFCYIHTCNLTLFNSKPVKTDFTIILILHKYCKTLLDYIGVHPKGVGGRYCSLRRLNLVI
jgi:hypothetical protein